MHGSKAKKLRKQVYGDYSHRDPHYLIINSSGTMKCIGYRAVYQLTKKGEKRE